MSLIKMCKNITGKKSINNEIIDVYVDGEGCFSKQTIIDRIGKGECFVVNGRKVNVVKNNGKDEYLRTDPNTILEDNLGILDQKCR